MEYLEYDFQVRLPAAVVAFHPGEGQAVKAWGPLGAKTELDGARRVQRRNVKTKRSVATRCPFVEQTDPGDTVVRPHYLVSVELIDGEKLVEMFQSLEIGLRPVTTYEVDPEFFEPFKA